ncbi:MAG: ABC transporter substrate-binding protein [Desulfobacterales bacterium]|nr:MAG: ABC transporter substrate-binding protein [Desulfobacterales bacterium]
MWEKTIRMLLMGSMFAVLLSACSSEQGRQGPPSAKMLKPISLQLQWVTQAQFAGYYVALDKGWYKEEGLDLTIKPGGPDLVPVDLVAAGASDFGTTLLADLAVAIQKGTPVISIGQIQQANGLLLVAKKNSGISGPKDFIGKKVGFWLGSWEAQFNALLAKEGIAEEKVNIVPQGWSMEPFLRGDLEVASAMIYNEYHVLLERGVKPEDLNIIDYADFGLGFPGDVLFSSLKQRKKDPDLCVGILRASLKGWQYATKHPEEAAEIVLKYDKTGVQTLEHQLAMMKEITKLVKVPERQLGETNEVTVEQMVDLLVRYKILDTPVQPSDIYTEVFLNSFSLK